ncbi:uncharacterized protein LOC121504962 [Cheilinus undulatus]|uniref:uncharacterized protein LOC121504962 n=1 Tax=Cheilinus undulatus TaxID=241271 RepID=UPI001BD3B797|nr:uncharacterized protein LOC121504962 [Cheilinus undulatus]
MVNAAPEKTSGRSSFESVNVGVSVTLPCKCQEKSTVMLYWYKKPLGQTPQLMSLYYQHKNDATFYGQFKGERFSLDTEDQKHHLTISDFGISDSATYFCLGSTLYVVEFCESITVSAKGLDSDVQAVIHQSESESTQIDDTLTVTCAVHAATCDGEHNVYWFKDSEETQPGLIYTHGGRNDQCERKPNSQSNTCAYNLPMQDVDPAHDGNYCTVASCGHVLFGKGTTLDSEGESSALVFILSALLAVTVLLITSLAVSFSTLKPSYSGKKPLL